MTPALHQDPKVSVVVPVYNGAQTIGSTLAALMAQTFKSYEVIVIDDGSTDATKEVVQPFPVRYLYQPNAGPAAARNAGWRAANGTIVAFTDSDCIPRPNWLEELIRPLMEDQRVGGVGGTYETANPQSALARLIGLEIKYRHQKMGRYIDAIGSYSAAFRLEALQRVGGFDEKYPKASGEDWDLSFQLVEAGYQLIYQPSAVVAHYHTEKLWKYLREQYTHGKWRVFLYSRYPGKAGGDSYTGAGVKYQVGLAGLSTCMLPVAVLIPRLGLPTLIGLLILLVGTELPLFAHLARRDIAAAALSLPVQFARCFTWSYGALCGVTAIARPPRSVNRDRSPQAGGPPS